MLYRFLWGLLPLLSPTHGNDVEANSATPKVKPPETSEQTMAGNGAAAAAADQPSFASTFNEPFEESVYHGFDQAVLGIKDELHAIAEDYPEITKLETIGHSIQGRPLLAMQIKGHGGNKEDKKKNGKGDNKGMRDVLDRRLQGGEEKDMDESKMSQESKTGKEKKGSKMKKNSKTGKKGKGGPSVFFVATLEGRDWIATQTAMRLIKHLTENYERHDHVKNIIDDTEIWVLPVANPDGYEHTFTTDRLWNKNLRDNDGDGEITNADGVNLQMNFPFKWGWDDEGSSGNETSSRYRGIGPSSEPEVQAITDFMSERKFASFVDIFAYGNNIMIPPAWQYDTEYGSKSLDYPIFLAQIGSQSEPSIRDSINDVGYNVRPKYRVNGSPIDWAYYLAGALSYGLDLSSGYGYQFPDNEMMVQTVFEDCKDFLLSVIKGSEDPSHPISPVNITNPDIYHIPIETSHGTSQIIEVLAPKKGKPKVYYQVNGGNKWKRAKAQEKYGRFYNDGPGLYYTRYVAEIRGQQAGDEISYTLTYKKTQVGPFNYTVASATGNPVLLLSAEDYQDDRPNHGVGYNDTPKYLTFYTEALDAAGYEYDVWDVTLQGVPSPVDIMSHYSAVIWYTGNDYFPVHFDSIHYALREYLNYFDGRLFATGQDLAFWSAYEGSYDDEFLQYYLGIFNDFDRGGWNRNTNDPFPIKGDQDDPIFGGMEFSIDGGDGASNQEYPSSFDPTSSHLPPFDVQSVLVYDVDPVTVEPHSGNSMVSSQHANRSFKRLGINVSLTSDQPKELKFWTNYFIEDHWDFAIVEIHEVGTEKWTTLEDKNGLTTNSTGFSCNSGGEGWVKEIHPFLSHYMDSDCNPTGTTGEWHGFTGKSHGWKPVVMDLEDYSGKNVEIYISFVTDGLSGDNGMFVDDIEITGHPKEDFEFGMGDWVVSSVGSSSPPNNWIRTGTFVEGADIPKTAAVRTPYSVYFAFGFEGIDTTVNRETVMDQVMQYLLQAP